MSMVNTAYERLRHYTHAWTDAAIAETGKNPEVIELAIHPQTWRDLVVTWDTFSIAPPWVTEDGRIVHYETSEPIQFGRFVLRRVGNVNLSNLRWWTPDSPLPEEMTMEIMQIAEVPNGSRIVWGGQWVTLTETRRHAMTVDDGTIWVVIDGKVVEPTVKLDTPVVVETVLS